MGNIKKIFFAIILVFFTLNVNSYSEIVNKVNVKGNERISLETIVIFGDIEIGQNYETEDVNALIKKLYETTFFSNISVELINGVLSIVVEENPIINSLIFKGEKANKYKEKLVELLTLREKTSFISNFVKSDVSIIKEFYKSLGFYFVEIEVEKEVLEKNRVNLIYLINKNEKAKISKIYFLGDKKIRERRLRDVITSQESKFWKFLSRNIYLNQGRIQLDKRLLKNYYKNKGYYEVDISSSNVEYAEGEGFVLTFSINAGPRYKFGKMYAKVSKKLDQDAFLSLEDEFDAVVGEYYSQTKLTSILEKVDKLSQQKELQFVNHRVVETLVDNRVDIEIDIYEGKKFTIERINIVGNNITNDSVIRGEMIVDEGDPYSEILINKSINKIKARNIFGKVDSKIVEGTKPDSKILEISVEEQATGEIVAGAGVGTDGTSFMFAVSENNWLGRGITLKSSLDLTVETISGSLAVTLPNYNYSGNSVFGSLDIASSDKTESSGYESNKTGFNLGTEFEQYENIYLAPSLSASNETIEAESGASTAIKNMEGTFTNIDFGYAITLDKRNQPYQPTAGHVIKWSQDLPLIQDSSAILNGINYTKYHGFSEDVIGALKFYGRSIHGTDDEVRLTSRLFIPQNRLRGFNTRRVGPKDGENWVGGNYVTAIGMEAQLPNLLPETSKTDISVFLDTGNVWSVDYDSSLDATNKMRSAVGVAANVFTAIGPLSFTIAQDITKAVNDETQSFNFRIGTSF